MRTVTYDDALKIVERLSLDNQRILLVHLQNKLAGSDDDWALGGDQLAFMLQHHDQIEAAYDSDDMTFLDELESSPEYKALFGDMPWDEAYDRYEETWWSDDDEEDA